MLQAWTARLLGLLGSPPPTSPSPLPADAPQRAPEEDRLTRPGLTAALEDYRQALAAMDGDLEAFLPALLARGRVESALRETETLTGEQIQQLIQLDEQLRRQVGDRVPEDLPKWREVVQPPDDAWWWFLDQGTQAREEQNDLPWVVLTGTMLSLTAPLAFEIVKRLWEGAPDAISAWGSIVTASIAGLPLFRRGRELTEWLLGRVGLRPRFWAEAMAAASVLAFVIVLAGRLWLVPQLGAYYIGAGHEQLRAGNLVLAEQAFQRAVALAPGQAMPFQDLGEVYQQVGRPQEALVWYQKALEQDLKFLPAYSSLGQLYNALGEFERAEGVLTAGLARTGDVQATAFEAVAQYRLLSELGQSYFAQQEPARAQAALEAAVALEDEVARVAESRGEDQSQLAWPHYYLAQLYEQRGELERARQHWEQSLRFLDPTNWADQDEIETARSHLERLEG